MFNFFKRKMFELDKNKKIAEINKDIKEEQKWNPNVPAADESEINKIGIAVDDNVIFSGAVDSYSEMFLIALYFSTHLSPDWSSIFMHYRSFKIPRRFDWYFPYFVYRNQ